MKQGLVLSQLKRRVPSEIIMKLFCKEREASSQEQTFWWFPKGKRSTTTVPVDARPLCLIHPSSGHSSCHCWNHKGTDTAFTCSLPQTQEYLLTAFTEKKVHLTLHRQDHTHQEPGFPVATLRMHIALDSVAVWDALQPTKGRRRGNGGVNCLLFMPLSLQSWSEMQQLKTDSLDGTPNDVGLFSLLLENLGSFFLQKFFKH